MTSPEHLSLGARALDALPADEATAFDEHLAGCDTCAGEYAEFLETAAMLAAAVAAPPPPGLRAEVLSAAAHTPQMPPRTTPTDTTGPQRREPVEDAGRHRTGAPWWRRPVTLVAAAVAAIVLIVGSVLVSTRGDDTTPDQAAQQCVDAAADAQVRSPSVGSGGSVTTARSCDAAVVQLASLPELPAGRGYQLWVMSGDQARSVGMVTRAVRSAGDVVITGLHTTDTDVGISVEPAAGSKAPTSSPVWVVPLPS